MRPQLPSPERMGSILGTTCTRTDPSLPSARCVGHCWVSGPTTAFDTRAPSTDSVQTYDCSAGSDGRALTTKCLPTTTSMNGALLPWTVWPASSPGPTPSTGLLVCSTAWRRIYSKGAIFATSAETALCGQSSSTTRTDVPRCGEGMLRSALGMRRSAHPTFSSPMAGPGFGKHAADRRHELLELRQQRWASAREFPSWRLRGHRIPPCRGYSTG